MVVDAELKILRACFGVEELRIAATKSERYVGEDCERTTGAVEEYKRADGGFLSGKGLIFGGKNFNIAPTVALRFLVSHQELKDLEQMVDNR